MSLSVNKTPPPSFEKISKSIQNPEISEKSGGSEGCFGDPRAEEKDKTTVLNDHVSDMPNVKSEKSGNELPKSVSEKFKNMDKGNLIYPEMTETEKEEKPSRGGMTCKPPTRKVDSKLEVIIESISKNTENKDKKMPNVSNKIKETEEEIFPKPRYGDGGFNPPKSPEPKEKKFDMHIPTFPKIDDEGKTKEKKFDKLLENDSPIIN